MANTVYLPREEQVDTLILTWTGLELWRATTFGGTYSLVATIPYVLHQEDYAYTDSTGVETDYYKARRYAAGPVYGAYSQAWTTAPVSTTLLSLKSTFFGFLNELYSSVATGGSVAKLTDSGLIGYTSETWPTKLEGTQLRITSGLASGDLRMVGKADRSEGDLFANRAFSAAVSADTTYELWGSAINGGAPLTTLFNDVTRGLRPITDSQVTVVTRQRHYSLAALVQSRRDLLGVYHRLLDPNELEPYRIEDLRIGLDYWAHDRGGAGTLGVTLELAHALTLNATVRELWVRHTTAFSEFYADSNVVDSAYRSWLAWEAVYELAKRKVTMGTTDRSRWTGLRDRAQDELGGWRAKFLGVNEPILIATFP